MAKTPISVCNLLSVCLITFTLQTLTFGQIQKSFEAKNITKDVAQDKSNIVPPKLILRYEGESGFAGFINDVLEPREKGLLNGGNQKVAIRICSQEKLLLALPLATQNPFNMIDFLTKNSGFEPSNIKLLRSEDCISTAKPNLYATELWTSNDNSDLIPNVEQYDYEQIKMLSLGFDPFECPKFDYKKATKELIKNMRNDSNSYGIVVKYFFEKPSATLNKRVDKVEKLLKKNRIPNSRYKITSQSWKEGESPCFGKEPSQPMIIFLTTVASSKKSETNKK
jgi:hypothetical protein